MNHAEAVRTSEQTSRIGVHLVGLAVEIQGWIFREQPIEDQGIDGHLEAPELLTTTSGSTHRRGTGRLIAVQIKAGPSHFTAETADGWWFNFSDTHARLWLNHSLPVIVMLVDTDRHIVYWQEVSERTVRSAGNGFKVEVPRVQTASTAALVWQDLTDGTSRIAPEVFETSLEELPPGVKALLVDLGGADRNDAALIAYHLAKGKHNAAGVVSTLLATRPVWITRNGGWAWRALGNYAASHELGAPAAEAFTRAGEAGGSAAARCFVAAAINALNSDRALAGYLTDRAEVAGAAPFLTAMLRAVLSHPEGDAAPIPMPSELQQDSEEMRGSAVTQSYLYIQAKRRGDVEGALRHSELMLAAEPNDTSAMAGRAEVILWAAAVDHVAHSEVRHAINLLREAISQRRRWGGPTLELTVAAARGCLLVGDFKAMLDVCLPNPTGCASAEDAADPEVQDHALDAATLLGRRDLVEQLAGPMGDNSHGRLAKYRVGALELTDEQLRDLLVEEFKDSIRRDDPVGAAQTALKLAQGGVDVTAALAPYIHRSIIPASTGRLATALLQVHNDLDAGLPGLRDLARTDKQAAELLVGVLRRAGRHREAVHACDSVLGQGRDPLFVILRALALVDAADPTSEVEAIAAAGEVGGFPDERSRLFTFAGVRAAERGDWVSAYQRLSAALDILEVPDAASVWRVVTAAVQLGLLDRAAQVVDRYRPQVRNDEEAKLWLIATGTEPWDASRASEALTLASRVSDPKIATALLGRIVTTTHGVADDQDDFDQESLELEDRRRLAQRAVPSELHRQAFLAMETLVERHGDEAGMFILRGEPEDLAEQMAMMLREGAARDRLITDFHREVRESRVPMGFLATLSGRGYATLLVQRAFGPLVSASPDDEEYGREVDAAADSLNSQVVVDASALLTVSRLTTASLLGQFARVLIPAGTLLDIHRALSDIRAAAGSHGSICWDTSEDALRIANLSSEEFVRQLHRVGALHGIASTLPTSMPMSGELIALLGDRQEFRLWVDPLQIAHEQNFAVWSDDLGQRRLAATLGVASFGTAALLDAMRAREVARAGEQRIDDILKTYSETTRAMAADLLVDLPLQSHDILKLAELDGWRPLSGAVAISRPAWWTWQTALGFEPKSQILEVFARVARELPEAFSGWQLAAMAGVARVLKPELVSRGLCELAFLGWGSATPDRGILDGISRARRVAQEYGFADPAMEMSAAAAHLAAGGLLSNPEAVVNRILHDLET